MFLDAPVKATLGRLSEGAAETFGSGNAVIGDHVVSASLLHNRRWRTVEGWATGRMALVQQQQPLEQCDSSVCEKQSSGEEATEWAVQIRRCVAPRDGDASDAAPPASRPNAWAAEPQPPAPEVALGASATLCDAFLPTSEDGNEEFCAVCWDGGDIVCCDHCEGSLHADCDERLRLFGVPEVEDAKVRCGACDLRCRLAIELELQGSRVGAIVARVASAVAASAPRKAPRDAAGVALAAAALAPVLQRWVAARVLWAAATTLDAAGARLCAAFVHLPARHLFPAVFQSELMAPLLVPDGAPAESGSGDGGAARIDASLPAPLSLTAVLDKLQSSVYEDGGRGGGGGAAVAAPAPQPPAVVAAPARKRRVSGAAAAGAFDPAASLTPLFTRGLRLFVAHLATVVGRTLRLSALQPVRLPILAAQLHLVVCAALRAALAQAGAVTFAILALERPGEALERPGEALDPGLVSAAAAGLEAAVAAVEAEVWDWLEAAAAAGAPPRVKVAKEKRILAAPLPKGDDGPTSEQVDGNKATRPSRAAIGSSATEDAAALPVTAVGISSSRPPAVGTLSASAAAAVLRLLQGPPATAVTSGGGRGGAAARQSVRVRLVSASLLKAALAAAVPREGPPAETSSAEPSAHGGLQPEDAGGLAAAAAAAAAGFRQALEADLERRRDALSTHPNDFDWLLAALLRDGGVSLDVARQLALTAKSVGASWPAEGTPAAAGGDVAAVATAAVAAAAASAAAPVTPNATSALDDALMSLLFPESARAILGPHVVPGLGLVTLVPRGSGDMLPVKLQEADVARARTALADPPAATAAGAAAPPACEGTTALMRSLGAFSEEAGSDAGGSAVVAAFRGDPLRCEGCRYGWNHLCAFSSVESALLADGTVLTPLVVEALQARLRAAAAPLAGAPQSRVAAPGDVASGVRAGLALQMEACDVLHQLPGAEGDGVEYPAAIPVLHPVAALARAFLAQQHADESRAGGGRGAGASQALRASARSLSGLEAPYVRAAVLGALATMGHAAITDAIPSAGADDGGGDDVAAAAAAGTAAGVGGSQPRSMRDAAALLARQLQLSTLPLRVAAVVADEVGTAAAAATTAAAVAGPAYPRPAPDAAAMAGSVSGGPVASAPDTEGRDSAPASGGGRMRGLKRRRAAAGAASGEAAQTDAAGRSPFPKGAAGAALRAIASQRRCDELLRLTFSDSLPASHTLAAAAIAGGGLVAAVRASSLLVDDPSRDGRTASASSPAFPDLLDRPVPPAVWPALNLEVTRNALASAAAASAGASSSIAAAATSSIAAAAAEGLSTIAADAAQVVGGRAAAVAGTLEAPLPDPDVTAALPTTLRQGLRMGPGNEDAFFLCWAVEEALRGSDSGGGPRGAAAEPALSQALLYGALREWRRERVAEMARPLPPSAPVIKEAVMAPASAPATAIPPSYAPSARLESYADWRERQGRTRALPSEPDCRGLAAAAPTYLVPELSALDPIRKTAQITDAAPPQLSQHAAAFERCVVAVPRFVPAVVRSQGIRALEARARHNAALLVLGRSRIEGTGVFAADDIAMDDVIGGRGGGVGIAVSSS